MKILNQLKFGPKLILVVLLVTALSVGLVTFFTNQATRTALADQIGRNLKGRAEAEATAIGDLVVRQINLLEALALNKLVQDEVEVINASYNGAAAEIQAELDKLDQQWQAADAANNDADPLVQARLNNEIASELREYRSTFPDNVEVFVTDQYGGLVASTNRTSDYYQADEEWWQTAYNGGQGEVYIGQLELDESTQVFALDIAVPLYGHEEQNIVGVLRSTYRMDTLASLINNVRLGQTGHAELFLPNNQVFSGETKSLTSVRPEIVAQLERTAGEAYTEFIYEGIPNLVSQARATTLDPAKAEQIDNLGWNLVFLQEHDEALRPVDDGTQTTIITSVVVLLLASLLAWAIANLITRPIKLEIVMNYVLEQEQFSHH